LEANGMRYRLQLHISHDTKGQLTAAMDSIDQGINGFRASQATESDSAIHLELPAVHSTYDGTLNSVRNSITGTWRQNGEPTQLTFKRSDQILELRRPQNPQKPYPYDEQELTFSNARAGSVFRRNSTGGIRAARSRRNRWRSPSLSRASRSSDAQGDRGFALRQTRYRQIDRQL
jgi:hypothetical protein